MMASSNRSLYAQQESTHPHLTSLPNSFPASVTKPRRSNATAARMTTPNPALISSNGMYTNDVPLHHIDQERQMAPSGMTLEFALNGSHDGNETVDENPRKRANNEPHEYPRRRVTTACEVCRGRKSRCDGAKPKCKLCTELKVECVYREPGVKLDAGDKLILEHLDRLDIFVRSSLGALMRESGLNIDPFLASNGSMSRDGMEIRGGTHPMDGFGSAQNGGSEILRESICSMSKVPTHPTLHLLGWPKLQELVSQSYDPQLLLQMEMKRKPLEVPISLSLDLDNKEELIQSFFEDANVWYACVNPATWSFTYSTAKSHHFREVPESCLVLLVLALGSTSSAGKLAQMPRDEEPPGMQYFSAAWGLMPILMTSHDIIASQCIVLASGYLFYLVRPFEAWTLLTSTNTKLQLLFSPSSDISPYSKELVNRVMWNAILFESNLHYELDLPQSNLIDCEASLDLPSIYPEEDDRTTVVTDESWYLIATISLHRLQLRIHQAVYSKDAPTTTAGLEPIMAELDASLSQWDESLPSSHRSPPTVHGHLAETCLLLRYYATRVLIFRPVLLAVLQSSPPAPSPTITLPPAVRSACNSCLDSCVRQLELVLAIDQQSMHSPYVWQETLSAVGQTLLVMGASMVAELAELLSPIDDLDGLIDGVVRIVEDLGRRAPSLNVAAEILREADGRRKGGWCRNRALGDGGRGGGGY